MEIKKEHLCEWKETRDQKGTFLTSCGKFFTLDTHNQNLNYSDYVFCPSCGYRIIEVTRKLTNKR
jgi:DNA-directed RNA polymerase subunit RPC12/RpoP